tara:strand:+ start:1513 stop:3924 length:2412 start_codon:yes stop_codon:yes gene_type:complete
LLKLKHFILYLILFITITICQNISIIDIEVEGLDRISKDEILFHAKLVPGYTLVKGDEISNAIKRLWNLKRFSNIQFYLEEETKDGIILKITLEELPVVGEINFIGNKKNKDRSLQDLIKITTGQMISENTVFSAKQNIIEKYKKDNFHNVIVDVEIIDTEINYIKNINFNISEGVKSRIKKISFNGNKNFPYKGFFKKNKLSKIFKNTKPRKWYAFWKGKFNNNDFEEDLKSLEIFYKNKGYRDFKILSKEILFNNKNIEIDIDVFEGNQYFYKSFNFSGNQKFTDQELYDQLDINIGDEYNLEKLEFGIYENITSLYMDEGHYFFSINKQEIPIGDDSLEVNFEIIENDIVNIRKIAISGNDKTFENVIRRELKIYPGDIFNRGNIIESMKSLYMLNYFESVEPEISKVSNSEIDVAFSVIEKETGRANFSMGYNEVNGFSGGGGFEFINFLGKGLVLSIDYQKGLQNQINSGLNQSSSSGSADFESYSISFTEPRIFDSKNSIGFSLYKSEQGSQPGSGYIYDTERIGGSITFGRQFKWPDYYTYGRWRIGVSSTKSYGDEDQLMVSYSTQPHLVHQDGPNSYAKKEGIQLTQTIGRTNVDNAEFSTTGSKLTWLSMLSGGILGGDENYHKHVFNFKWYTPVLKKLVLYQNFTFGALYPLIDNEYLYSSTYFSMGGSGVPRGEMLRGYPDNRIGPMLPNTIYAIHAGNIMFKYSTELRYLISSSPTVYFLLFADTGNIWSDFDNVDIFDLKRSLGIGIRINMPMLGIIGYDIGYGFDHYDDSINKPFGWEQHLIFGVPLN